MISFFFIPQLPLPPIPPSPSLRIKKDERKHSLPGDFQREQVASFAWCLLYTEFIFSQRFKFLRSKSVIVVHLTRVYFVISVNSGTNSKPTRRQSEMTSPRKSMWYPEKEEQQTRKVVHDFVLVFFFVNFITLAVFTSCSQIIYKKLNELISGMLCVQCIPTSAVHRFK